MDHLKLAFVLTTFLQLYQVCHGNAAGTPDEMFSLYVTNSLTNYRDSAAEDPIEIEGPIEVDIDNPLFRLSGEVRNVEYGGQSLLKILNAQSQITEGKFDLHLMFPNATLSGEYSLNGSLAATFPIDGDGFWTVVPEGLGYNYGILMITIEFETVDGYVVLNPDIFKFQFTFNGDGNGNEFPIIAEFTDLIDDSTVNPELITETYTFVGEYVRDELKPVIADSMISALFQHLQADFDKLTFYEIISGLTAPPESSTTEIPDCKFELDEFLSNLGYNLINREESSVVLSTETTKTAEGLVVKIITEKTIRIPAN